MRLVMGTTGEYEDRKAWPVAAFTSARRAATWARKANEWAAANSLAPPYVSGTGRSEAPSNPWDPCMSVDYTGVEYFVGPDVPLDPSRP